MTITVNTPDGGTAQFPDDTPKDTIASAMKAKFGGPDSNAMPDAERNPLGIFSKLANTIADTATFGLPDTIAGALGGKTQQMRSDTAADRADIGLPLSTVADAIGYGMGGGALGVGEKAAAGLAARGVGPRLAQAGGSALEAGAATAAGDVGHGEAPGWDVATNATVGGALGGLIGGRKIGEAKPQAVPIADLEAEKNAAFQGTRKPRRSSRPRSATRSVGRWANSRRANRLSLRRPSKGGLNRSATSSIPASRLT